MKQIKNASELKEGQKYLIELEYRYDKEQNIFPIVFEINKNDRDISLTKDLKDYNKDENIVPIYEKQDVEAIDTPCLDEHINELEIHKSKDNISERGENTLTELKKIKSILKNIPKQVEFPVVGEMYEFSMDGKSWYKCCFNSYRTEGGNYHDFIRPIQQSEEETKAIELLKNLGYKVEK